MPKTLLRKLQIGFGLSSLILLASSTASYISIKNQMANRSRIIHTQETIKTANQILIDLQNAETGQRGYHLTGREHFLEPYHQSRHSLPQSVASAYLHTGNDRVQSSRVDSIANLVTTRLSILDKLVAIKKEGGAVTIAQLEQGKLYMDSCRNIINRFIADESLKYEKGSEKHHENSRHTSFFILTAAALSLFITFIFYWQIRKEFKRREKLQQVLIQKDEDVTRRLAIIQDVAARITKGDYSGRIGEQQKDDLGAIAASLNNMAEALQTSFENINNNEWKQSGLASLNEVLTGNKTESAIANDALVHLVTYGDSTNGAFYLLDQGVLNLEASYGLEGHMKDQYGLGEGVIGQVFRDKEIKHLRDIAHDAYTISFGVGQVRLSHMIWLPLIVKGQCFGVVELGSMKPYDAIDVEFYKEAVRIVALEIVAAKSRKQVQLLLEETQAQQEELQTQHGELESLNTELETQTQKLQASEEELRVQQEELMQSNQELEERSKLLEEKNHLIEDRNREIQKKAEELALSTKYKSEFLANMSHELRTPLNSILLLSRLMVENADHNLNEDQMESARVIQSSGSSLLTLIDDILDLSKIEAGRMELEYQPVSLIEIKTDLINMFQPLAKEKWLELTIKIEEDTENVIYTDKLRLEQVLRNLLSNAIKFTTTGSVKVTIFQQAEDPDFIRFSVKDTGIGISEDNQKIIFEAFQQADGSTRRRFGGTGLGLSISREIARLLGGEITVKSRLNAGSTFCLTIPKSEVAASLRSNQDVAKEEAVVKGDIPDILSPTEKAITYTVKDIPEDISDDRSTIQPGDKVILIVEDDTDFARALLKFTHQQGYKAVVIVRGDQAMDAAIQYQPLGILLDIQLPVKDGWQVMDEIKSNPETKHIPVHIMSSLQVKKESLMKGAIDFINKPVALEQISQIFTKIDDALNRNPKKVLIVEENPKHATALSYFLSNYNVVSEIKDSVEESINALQSDRVNCVILDMGVPDRTSYEMLEAIKSEEGLENLPIIIFTGKNLSHAEEVKIKQYADSIVIKTAHSFQRILDEVELFLHLVEEHRSESSPKKINKLGSLNEVLNGKTVLIADDDVRNIFSLTKTLEKYQMNVISAVDGRDALLQLERYPELSVILMDMMMPEMDGYETIREIRKIPRYAKLPIIAVTAKAMTGDREKCIGAGASDYISKPVDKDQLLSLLRVWLYE